MALHLHGDDKSLVFGGGLSAELSHWYNPWGGLFFPIAYELLHHENLIHNFVVVADPALLGSFVIDILPLGDYRFAHETYDLSTGWCGHRRRRGSR